MDSTPKQAAQRQAARQAAQHAAEQAALWNGPAGHAWVDAQEQLDRMLQPFEDLLMQAVRAAAPRRLLDVGCGAGSTTLAAARLLGDAAHCTGVDISQPLVEAARARARRAGSGATFVCGDAQAQAFEPPGFDLLVSRFGVMFFGDPVAAFANLRRAAAPGAGFHFTTWRSPDENPFMTTAERAASALLPGLPARQPGAPGQFALDAEDRIRAILAASGWEAVAVRPVDVECGLAEPELLPYLRRLGPLGRALQALDDAAREEVLRVVRAAFEPFVQGDAVRFTAACWLVEARAPAA